MNGQIGKRADGQSGRRNVGSNFRQLLLWRKAQDFAQRVIELVTGLPHDRAADVIGGQLLRAAASISANIAAGYGRYSQAAYRNHLSMARGSAFEAESWLDLLARRAYVDGQTSAALLDACVEVQKLLTLRMKSLAEGKSYAVRELGAEYGSE